METQSLLQRSQSLKSEAQDFLNRYDIDAILGKYFNVRYTGSFSYDLMCWRDIDIVLELKESSQSIKDAFGNVFAKLITKNGIADIHYMDGSNFEIRRGLPKGHYLGFDIQDDSSNDKWKVDTWLLDKQYFQKSRKLDQDMRLKLNLQNREKIIRLKFRYMNNSNRVPSLISYYIYNAVLFKNFTNEEEIIEYVNNKISQ
jgi:hypothetical protein